ncbi:SCO family protein [Advenella alkanexedens]|uniref:SCO family protein n=1 Tax=Advenella alkanexedens TaxID=1481665 RepID=UPI00267577E2|nr:SCO family protein [Advenella alkanexedens]WKU20598.1 SCO family protein [Advenella alkanexedens]
MSINQKRRLVLTGLGILPLMLAGCSKEKPLVVHGQDITGANFGRDFNLQGPNGKRYTLNDFKGKALMIFFGFTQCPDVCPTALARAVEIKGLLGEDADKLQVLFITIDPERDTPEMLEAYTNAFDPSFMGLYGTLDETQAVAKEFKIYYKKVPTGSSYTMDHSALSYIFDTDGKLRLSLSHAQSAQECAEDIRQLLA